MALTYVKASRPRTPKGVIARARAKKRRAEGPVIKQVRAACVERDGYCRIMRDYPGARYLAAVQWHCRGWSEWAHFGKKKRAKTRGMKPTDRHTTAGSLMLCEHHHDAYDDGELIITAQSEAGCDGPLAYRWKD